MTRNFDGIIGLTGMGGVDAKTFAGLGDNIAAICERSRMLSRMRSCSTQ